MKGLLKTGFAKLRAAVRLADRKVVGPMVFKNSSGVIGTLRGRMARRRARKATRSDELPQPRSEEARLLQEQGFVFLGQPFEDSLIEQIRSTYQTYIQKDDVTAKIRQDGEVYNRALSTATDEDWFDFGSTIPEIQELLRGQVGETIKSHYQSHFEPDYLQAYRNFHVPDQVIRESGVYSQNWHCDGRTTDYIKLFVNLSDVTDEDGPFHVISRADTKKIMGADYDRRDDGFPHGKVEERATIRKGTGPAGTAFLANTNRVLHRAGIPDPGRHRDLLVIQIRPATEPLSEDWLSDYDLRKGEGR